jgi:hypothetical protein
VDAYVVGCVDCGERALEAAHLLGACVCLAAEVSAEQVVIAILDCCQLVVFRGELVCVVAEECALTREKVVAGIVAKGIEIGGITASFALAWGRSASRWSLFGGASAIVEPTSVELV